jgi:hypothetical protein
MFIETLPVKRGGVLYLWRKIITGFSGNER